jgi:hypothetical protein
MSTQELVHSSPIENRWVFLGALVLASGPALFATYDMRSNPIFAAGLLVGWAMPLLIAFLIFRARRYLPAWGWLLAVLLFSYFVVANVLQSANSTASLDFLFAPVWNTAIVGPAGALVGLFLAWVRRKRTS